MEALTLLQQAFHHAAIDYRFLQPWQITDINGNPQEVQRDGTGFVVASSFYGTEQGIPTGFAALSDSPVSCATSVSALIADNGQLLYQQNRNARDLFSWQQQQGTRMPIQSASLPADDYPQNSAQQVRTSVVWYDGFGRILQSVMQVPAGDAWQRTADGELATDDTGALVVVHADPRWAVSGRVEYDNKGLPVRQYQPWFIDSWQYVKDDAMRSQGYADRHYYDALGREVRVETANGYQRRSGYYPWFTVTEDENDTQTA